MRDTWTLLLFVGGLIVGGAAGAAYHRVKIKLHEQTIEARDRAVEELNTQLEQEQKAASAARKEASAEFDQLQREYDTLQVELAEQKELAKLQREKIGRFIASDQGAAEAVIAENDPNSLASESSPESNDDEEGRVRGGKFVYRKLKMARLHDEFEIKGEIENRSKKTYGSAYFHIDLYGEGREPVDKFVIVLFNFEPGETRAFEEHASPERPAMRNEVRRWSVTAALLIEDK